MGLAHTQLNIFLYDPYNMQHFLLIHSKYIILNNDYVDWKLLELL